MKQLKKIPLLLVLLCCGAFGLHAQERFVPFPQFFYGNYIFNYNEVSPDDSDGYVGVMGRYIYNSERTIAASIGNTTGTHQWKRTFVNPTCHYEQLLQSRQQHGADFYFFSDTLPYYEYMSGSLEDSASLPLDSIRNAYGIAGLFPVNDTLMYAMIDNGDHGVYQKSFYIAKKKGRAGWQTVPVVVRENGHRPWLRNSILWVAGSLLYLAVMLFILFRRKAKLIRMIQEGGQEVQDLKLRADRPLDKNQLAEGDMKQAITAIADVIANRNTPLPMTIAINGAWGSGKSSIMNCIRQMLEENKDQRFITTWFNAWHQESESSLLNAFLLKVIRRCEQPFFRKNIWDSFFASVKFRTRLATTRFVKQPGYRKILTGFTVVLFAAVILDLCVSLYYMNPKHEWRAADLHLLGHTIDWRNLFSITNVTTSVITVLLPIVSFFFLQSEKSPTLGAFANIIYKKNFALDAEKKVPDMREKFRTEYWEIMGALGDKTLIVFIDDLDRVGGKKIFEMLEALNFISDVTSKPDDSQQESFRAVFVLGLYVDQVAENLGSYLIDSKETIASSYNNDPSKLGLQYLEKMIQLNVPVPLSPNDISEPTDAPKNAS